MYAFLMIVHKSISIRACTFTQNEYIHASSHTCILYTHYALCTYVCTCKYPPSDLSSSCISTDELLDFYMYLVVTIRKSTEDALPPTFSDLPPHCILCCCV